MSHLSVDSVLSADVYNRLMIDHDATEHAAFLQLKRNYLPELSQILTKHGVADFVELHLLHRHFDLQEGEAVVHRALEIPGSKDTTGICVDIGKAMSFPKPVKSSLVPLLWMASSGNNLVAYEYGLDVSLGSRERRMDSISSEAWIAFAQDFSAHVHAAGVADIVSLKDKQCINGGEYVVPGMRVLFRVPTGSINLQPGSGVIESGWGSKATTGPDADFPECTDGHVTKTKKTIHGTVATSHVAHAVRLISFVAVDILTMSVQLMTQDDAAKKLLAYAFSGAIGSAQGKAVTYSLISTTPTTFAWSVALEDWDADPAPIDRSLIKIDRQSKEILAADPIVLSESELREAILSATGQHMVSSSRFTDGLLSISYKVTVQESPDISYVVQLRHHGRIASMDFLMAMITETIDPRILPVPPVYPIPGEKERQEATGMGRQITRFIPGDMASTVYPRLSHKERLVLVRKMALAFQACWRTHLPQPHLIGELLGDPSDGLTIGPDRQHSLGGPFQSVRDYLRAYFKYSFSALEKQQGIDEYKAQYLDRIKDFLDRHEHDIPVIVEDTPIVAMHTDMGLHNIIVSSQTPTAIQAIIDWEFAASSPYASQYRIIEMLFRKPADNQFGPEYDRANELREAFWDAIPDWKRWNSSEATQTFLEWFRFGLFMKPEPRPNDLQEDEKQSFWQENIRVVEGMLSRF